MTESSEIPEAVRAYVAGLLDGEGCIHIARVAYLPTGRSHFAVQVIISNNNKPLLEWLQGIWGGYVVPVNGRDPRPRWRQGWAWRIQSGRQCGPVLRAVEPYLRLKGPLVRVALELIDYQAAHNKRYGRHPLPESVYQQQVELHGRHLGLSRLRHAS